MERKRDPVVVGREGCRRITWIWAMSWESHGSCTLRPWYLGGAYTSMLGSCHCIRREARDDCRIGAIICAQSLQGNVVVTKGYSIDFRMVAFIAYQRSSCWNRWAQTAMHYAKSRAKIDIEQKIICTKVVRLKVRGWTNLRERQSSMGRDGLPCLVDLDWDPSDALLMFQLWAVHH